MRMVAAPCRRKSPEPWEKHALSLGLSLFFFLILKWAPLEGCTAAHVGYLFKVGVSGPRLQTLIRGLTWREVGRRGAVRGGSVGCDRFSKSSAGDSEGD